MQYYTGIVCQNGHKVARRVFSNEAEGITHCPLCGAKAIDACLDCQKSIRGGEIPTTMNARRDASADDTSWPLDAYCYGCGKAYPWTVKRAEAATETLDELEQLTEFERGQLKGSIVDIMADTTRTEVGAIRWKKTIAKYAGTTAQGVLTKLLADLASAAAKNTVGF
jgi:hypothetical protein